MKSFEEIIGSIEEEEIIKLTQELVKIPSENPPGNEEQIAEFVASWLEKEGLFVEIDEVEPKRLMVIASVKNEGPAFMLCGHLDTIPVVDAEEWRFHPFSGRISEGKLYGRGSVDMKGGISSMMVAMKTLKAFKKELKADALFVATVDEEVAQKGAEKFIQNKELMNRVECGIVGEPTNLDPKICEKGAFWLELTSYGIASHGSMPELGKNAIMSLYKVLDKIQERFPTHTRDHSLVGPTTTNIGTIQGGVKINIVPDLCNATIDTRYPPGITVDQLKAELNKIIEEEKKSDPRLDIKHTVLVDRPPVEINESEPFVQTLLDTIEQVEGKKRECGGVSYFTDASVLSPAGIPLIIYGVGNAGMAHKRDEYLDIEQLETCAKVYTLMALKFNKDF